MTPFVHEVHAARVVFGAGAMARVAGEVERLGRRHALVVATGSAKEVGQQLAADLGDRCAGMLTEVRQHVPEELAGVARSAARTALADAVVAVGGGSAIGLAKAVAVDGPVDAVPVVAVPTTYSGSECTPIYGITGTHKRTGRDPRAQPRVVVYDPELTLGLPPDLTAASGFNALAHCVEALYAPGTNPVVALLAEEGVRVLARALPAAVADPGDLAARSRALYGAHLAGTALASADMALHHKLCHVLGGTFGLAHAATNVVVLPHVAAYNGPAAPAALAAVSAALGGPAEPGEAGGRLHDLARRLGAPTSLAALGMPAARLDEAADLVLAAVGDANPRPVDRAGARELLAAAHEGRRP